MAGAGADGAGAPRVGATALGLLVAWWPWLRRPPLAWSADITSPRPPETVSAAEG